MVKYARKRRVSSVRSRLLASGPAKLTPCEREVLNALLENLLNEEVAKRLHISERTAKLRVSNLLAKFGVRRRADLALLYFQAQVARP